ncbi:MAG: class I SAM-dependent methyltransferase [Variovorax sp.]|nr:class I SAM-dependent methyltransferase [Variovorax sp.]
MPFCRVTSAFRCVARTAGAVSVSLTIAACVAPAPPAPDPSVLSSGRIAEIVASPDRSDADRVNDRRRKPEEMLTFVGVRPGMTALDLSAAGGYTTELIARAVGPTGRVYGQSPPAPSASRPAQPEGAAQPMAMGAPSRPSGPRPSPVALAERAKNPKAGNIVAVVRPFEHPAPPDCASNCLDLVTLMFNYHDFGHMGVDRGALNRAVFAALKPGGMYVIADHSGRPGTGISESGTLHRIEEAFLRKEVEQAGFKLVAEGDFLRNPSDPRDRNTPEPPQPKDEFVLKFVKP